MTQNRAWTWRHAILRSQLPATTRHVLLTVSCYMNEVGGGCYPTQEQLADATGLTDRAIRTHLEVAEKSGWLERKEHGFRGQRWRNHEYFAKWPETQDVDEGEEQGSAPSDERSGTSFQKVRNDVPTILPDTSSPLNPRKVTNGLPPLDVDVSFKRLTSYWPPAKIGIIDRAQSAFENLPKSEQAKAVLSAELAVKWHNLRHQRLPVLATYLREGAYEVFHNAPPVDFDGDFIITPDRQEWVAWLDQISIEHNFEARERVVAQGKLLTKTRWPVRAGRK